LIPCLIVPVLTRRELLTRFILSISHPVQDLVIINNESNLQRWEKPPLVSRIHHIDIPTNLGVAASWNLGFKAQPYHDYWMIANFDVILNRFLLEDLDSRSARDKLVLSSANPPWCVFTLGADLLDKVGLFDEGLYPAYFEDTDYMRRCEYHGIYINYLDVKTQHDNSSTIKSDSTYRFRNNSTFQRNQTWYDRKQREGDQSQGGWDLALSRENDW
jgi:GT2 family glycosyltransferase